MKTYTQYIFEDHTCIIVMGKMSSARLKAEEKEHGKLVKKIAM